MKVITTEDQRREYRRDAGIIEIEPRAILVVETLPELVEAMDKAKRDGFPITPRGSGTSIPSQAVGNGYVIVHAGRSFDMAPGHVSCGPGMVKADLNAQLDKHGGWLPVDPSSYKACSVGGMVSNNSSGVRTFKYGSTIDFVEELEVLLPEEGARLVKPMMLEDALSGDRTTRKVANLLLNNWKTIQREVPRTTKNSSGYRLEHVLHDGIFDLPKLFTGSEGTLCLINRIKLRTITRPPFRRLVVVNIQELGELDRVVSGFRAQRPSAVELLDKSIFTRTGRESVLRKFGGGGTGYLIFCEIEGGREQVVEESLELIASDDRIAQFNPEIVSDSSQISEAWEVRNLTLTIAGEMRKGSRFPVPGVEDVTVPQGRLGELLGFMQETFEENGLDYISYGHAGDANLHMRPLLDPKERSDLNMLTDLMEIVFAKVWKLGGTITGEHGDGMLRAPFVKKQYPETYEVMVEVKETFDPKGLLNPMVKIQVKK